MAPPVQMRQNIDQPAKVEAGSKPPSAEHAHALANSSDTPNRSPQKVWMVGTLLYTQSGLVLLFFWLLWGDFAWSLKERSVPAVMQLMLKQFDASDTVTAILLSTLPAILGLLFGPTISYKSDRYRSRWGRRIPFLFLMVPVTTLGMFGLAFSPVIGAGLYRSSGGVYFTEHGAVIISFATFWAIFEFATMMSSGLLNGLINDVVPQAVIGRFYGLFRVLSLVAGILFNFYFIGYAKTHYFWIFVGFGVFYGVAFTFMCLMVKEGDYPPSVEAESSIDRSRLTAIKTYFRECFGNPYYVIMFASGAVATLVFSPFNLFSIFYAASVGISVAVYGKCLALTYVISLALAYPLGSLADRFHPLRLSLVIIGIYGVFSLWAGFFARTPWLFGIAFVAHGVIAGVYFTASASFQ